MELGSDKLKLLPTEKDDIEEQLGRDKIKADKSVADGERKLSKTIILWPTEKVDGS
jgi:hypothetical protein